MKLPEGQKGIIYTIKSINGDEEINKFLFTLGCFEGETISIVKKMYSNLIINIKGGRYGYRQRPCRGYRNILIKEEMRE